jgi:Carboxypeptidase regulatory-like domain
MRNTNRVLPLLSLLVLCPVFCTAQTPARDSSASISGRVTVGGKGAAGITVVAAMRSSVFDNKTVAKTATDDDGNYRLMALPAGSFTITPIAKAFVAGTGSAHEQPGQLINVAEGESITRIDFAFVRGGVITGRITDAQGNPLIGERVSLILKNTPDTSREIDILDGSRNKTDDRGIYRIYGLRAGNYKVSVGRVSSFRGAGNQYAKTFYPGVQEESKATIIELKEGAEVTGIDISPGKSAEGYSVSGRVVDAESGQPVSNVSIGYSSYTDANQLMGGEMKFTDSKTDANGKFRLEGIRPGRYAAFIGQGTTSYSDLTPFDISEGDVTGIEIKVRRGGTIDGVAVIENNADPAVAALLPTAQLYTFVQAQGGTAAPLFSRTQINPDGSFRFVGLAPGKVRILILDFPNLAKGLTLVRTELDGVDQQDGIEMAAGAQITGVRLVVAYGTGSIRGEVKIEGGVLPEGTTFRLYMRSTTSDTRRLDRYIEVDARGHFFTENIPPGTYELSLHGATPDPKQTQPFEPAKQTITVANGAEVRVIFVVDLAAKKAGSQ